LIKLDINRQAKRGILPEKGVGLKNYMVPVVLVREEDAVRHLPISIGY